MAQLKTKLSVRQMRRLMFAFGLLSFLTCLAVAAGLMSWSVDREIAFTKPLEQSNDSGMEESEQKELNLSDFGSIINVKLQGKLKAKPVRKIPKVVSKPAINIQLRGVFFGGNQDSFGVFEANGKEKVVKLGETIGDNGPVLTEVAGDYVLVKYAQQPARKIELPAEKQ